MENYDEAPAPDSFGNNDRQNAVREKGGPPGRNSIMWDTITDLVALPLLLPIATMQSATPAVGTAVNKYAIYKTDPFERARRTSWSLMRFLIDGGGVATREAEALRNLHTNIKGTLDDGTSYFALNPKTYRIVPDTFLDGVIRIRRELGKPLTPVEEEILYEEYTQLCLLFGIPRKYIEPTLKDFWVYYEDLMRNKMTYNQTVHHLLYKGIDIPPKAGKLTFLQPLLNQVHERFLHPTFSLSARGGLHPVYREVNNIKWTDEDQQAYDRLCLRLQKFAKRVPRKVRYHPTAMMVLMGMKGPSIVTFEELKKIEIKRKAWLAKKAAGKTE